MFASWSERCPRQFRSAFILSSQLCCVCVQLRPSPHHQPVAVTVCLPSLLHRQGAGSVGPAWCRTNQRPPSVWPVRPLSQEPDQKVGEFHKASSEYLAWLCWYVLSTMVQASWGRTNYLRVKFWQEWCELVFHSFIEAYFCCFVVTIESSVPVQSC